MGEKILTNHVSGKRQISRTYVVKNSYNSTTTTTIAFKNERRTQTFSRDDIQYVEMANKHVKRCSASLLIKDLQVGTAMRYQLITGIRMATV